MATEIHVVQFQKGDEATAMCGASLRRPKDKKAPLPWTIFNNRATCPKCYGRYHTQERVVIEDEFEWEDA